LEAWTAEACTTETALSPARTTERPLSSVRVAEVVSEESNGARRRGGVSAAPEVKKRRRRWPFLVVAVVLLIGASLLTLTPAGRHRWDVSVLRRPTAATTLSFDAAEKLPSSATAGETVHLLFAVVNNEGRRIDYPFTVTSTNADGSDARVLERSTVDVPADRVQQVAVSAPAICTDSVCRLTIRLPEQAESIDVLIRIDRATT